MYPGIIQHIKNYVPLSNDDVDITLSYLKMAELKKKEYLLKEGQVCKANYFVEKGMLRMFLINDKGIEQTTQFAIENWWMADHMSLLNQAPSQFNIQAVEASEVYALDHHAEEKLLAELPQLEKYFRVILQRAFAASQFRIKYFYSLSKEENYRFFTSSFPGFVQRIPQYMLASYLNFTPEYLSELRKKHGSSIS